MGQVNYDSLREMITHCEWTFAKTMPFAPHERLKSNGRLGEIDACVKHLRRIGNNYCSELMNKWSKQLSKDFPNYKKCEFLDRTDVMYTGVTIPYKDIPDAIAIRIHAEKGSLIYGFTYMPKIQEMRDELQESLSYIGLCNDLIKGTDWLYYKYTSYEKGYEKLKELIEIMTNA